MSVTAFAIVNIILAVVLVGGVAALMFVPLRYGRRSARVESLPQGQSPRGSQDLAA